MKIFGFQLHFLSIQLNPTLFSSNTNKMYTKKRKKKKYNVIFSTKMYANDVKVNRILKIGKNPETANNTNNNF